MKKLWPIFAIIIIIVGFFWQFLFKGLIPIPADTIVGLYNPYRDYYAKDYPRGIPFKNFMITDPVRQQYPWKSLVVDVEKNFQIPLWNPYNFSGYPMLANFQSSVFYPLNILFFLLPFSFAWGIFILLGPFLAMVFTYLYMDHLKIDKRASLFSAIVFGFSGFSISWLEWGNIIHTALWLPLILLSLDKLTEISKEIKSSYSVKLFKWQFILFLSLFFSFFAGHLQIFFYTFAFSVFYFLWNSKKAKNVRLSFFAVVSSVVVFLFVSSIQWISTVQFILLSARNLDQNWHSIPGWFVPWQNAIQVIIPDFFGNPATLNYWGVWNYGEFVSYIGVGAFIFVLFSLLSKDRLKYFFIISIVVCVLLAFPTIIAKISYKFSIPLLSTSQPTRLIFLIDFCLSILVGFGFNYFLNNKNRKMYLVLGFMLFIFAGIWVFVIANSVSSQNYLVTKQNLIFPTILLFVNIFIILGYLILSKKISNPKLSFTLSILIIGLIVFDLMRFGFKYTPFTSQSYLYPKTKTIEFLQKNLGFNRYISEDSRIFPPNFSIMYKLQTLDGYDPLYISRYAEIIAALERGSPDIHAPFGFNRIITPSDYHSHLIDLFGVKYVMALNEIKDPYFKKVFQEGDTKIYQNKNSLPRTFFVRNIYRASNKQDAINYLFDNQNYLSDNAVVENGLNNMKFTKGQNLKAIISKYEENNVEIKTDNPSEGFLVLTDSFYPTWHAKIDDKETNIYLTDYNFRGIIVPKGVHTITFYDKLF